MEDAGPRRVATGIRRGLAAVVMLACLVLVFRDALLSRLQMLYGDSYDGLIEVAILDHWYRVFTAGAAWDVTGYFHPHAATLGYNDGYIVPGIAFTLARIAGADPFVATFAAYVAMKALGFAGMYVLLRRAFRVATPLALAGAALLTVANVSLVQIYHGQLLSIALLPWLTFLAIRTGERLRGGQARGVLAYGCGFAVLYGIAALNAFYGLWFFSLFLLVFAPVALLLIGAEERRAWIAAIRRHGRALAVVALVAGVALLPMLRLYLPLMTAGARHSWEQGPYPHLIDLPTVFDVGPGNWIWGRLPAMLGAPVSLPGGEAQVGLPIGMMIATLFALSWAWRERRAGGIALPVGIALAILVALAWRGPGGHAAWWYVYSYVPGAGAIRVVSRLLLFAIVGVIVVLILFLDRKPRPPWLTALILAGLFVEQMQGAAPLHLDRQAQRRMLATVGTPPAPCTAIFVVSARPADYPASAEARAIDTAWGGGNGPERLRGLYRHNVDAMLLASYTGRPTINGFSTFNPPDWHLADPDAADYRHRVRAYAARHALHGLCGLDMRRSPHWFPLARW